MGNAVVDAIRSVTSDPHVQAAMLMGSNLESSWNTGAVGDNGTSFGPFQIHITVHPGVSSAQAQDPVFAAKYMLPAYQAGVSKVPPALWQSDPAQASALAAYYAERPAKMYAASAYQQKWSQVQAALNGADISGPVTGASGGAASGGGSLLDPAGLITGVEQNFTHGLLTFANMALFFAAGFAGSLFVLGGIAFIFWGSPMGKRAGDLLAAGVSFAGPEGAAVGTVLRARSAPAKLNAARQGRDESRNRARVAGERYQRQRQQQQKVQALQFKKGSEQNG